MSACDKVTGNSEKITITNDKGRLSKEDIEKMVSDADKFRAQDDAIRKRVENKNALENYCFTIKNTLNDNNLKHHFTDEDKFTIMSAAAEGLQYLASDPQEYAAIESKQKEIETKFNPIMMRVYQAAGVNGGIPGTPNTDYD